MNAFTSKECTCFHSKVLDHHIEIPIKVLSEMITTPSLAEEDIEKEKGVVLDEILMAEDTPDDVSYDLIAKTIYQSGSLSRPILGTEKQLNRFDKTMISSHMKRYYTTDNMVISIAGSFDEKQVLNYLNQYFNMPISQHQEQATMNTFHSGGEYIYKATEQVHLEIGYNGLPYGSKQAYSLAALNNILGASVSSRLFQNIREAEGLTYTINSYATTYENTGLFSIYASMQRNNLEKVTRLIQKELQLLISKGITNKEVERVKEQLKGNYILDLESTDSYMNLLGKGLLFNIPIKTPEEVEKSIDDITKESIEDLIQLLLNTTPSVAIVGKVDENILQTCIQILGGHDEAIC